MMVYSWSKCTVGRCIYTIYNVLVNVYVSLTINFVPPKCGPYRLKVTAGAQEIPQSPADITIYDPTPGGWGGGKGGFL